MIIRVCPNCRSTNIHRSRRHGPEFLMALLLLRPYRCKECEKRFWAYVNAKTLKKPVPPIDGEAQAHENELD